jgi:hypothetical protein
MSTIKKFRAHKFSFRCNFLWTDLKCCKEVRKAFFEKIFLVYVDSASSG